MPDTSDWTQEQLTGLSDSHLTSIILNERNVMVHKQVKEALLSLVTQARKQGFDVGIASSFRDFKRQQLIWNNKYLGTRPLLDSNGQVLNANSLSDEQRIHAILRWSALPGASRHHWGCDFDLYAINLLPADVSLQLEPWEYLTGHQAPFYQWLMTHAKSLGFFFPYAEDKGGVAVEPWHLSHKAVATNALATFNCQMLSDTLNTHPIEGNAQVLKHLDSIYTQYVSNISTL
ncbi:peptidase M15 [Vibrio sp. UCD-FRSSP16_10]|uniref:M15 family metallopeptidase n=1 Tax=unclassified Vibrio TaxID=2614977 RepID=UPI0007FE0C81|nr:MULTISPECIES: M15 family metallopeptidase [unclassified Vibrio]OBT08633.1 peptidase M15 [Vibrio sp. UCD-FRSSP16_30]OBT18163.1 peptidase M15 [Vibrio sp. UCD-FRSSP16_10]